jgi:hypothetical protein
VVVKPIFKSGYFAKTNFSAANTLPPRKATAKTNATTPANHLFIFLLLSSIQLTFDPSGRERLWITVILMILQEICNKKRGRFLFPFFPH